MLSVSPFDLHVLSTPPAFVLSQDQTLHKIIMKNLDGSLYIEIVVPCGTCFGAKSTAHLALTSFLMHYLHCLVFREHHAAVADSFYILTQLLCCVNILFCFFVAAHVSLRRLCYIIIFGYIMSIALLNFFSITKKGKCLLNKHLPFCTCHSYSQSPVFCLAYIIKIVPFMIDGNNGRKVDNFHASNGLRS